MKKRMLTLLLLVLALLLAGCSGGEENVAGTVSQIPDTTEAPAETEAPAGEENELSLGRMEGGVYTNTYTGYGCTLDSAWTFYTAEELQELPANTAELFEDSEYLDSDKLLAQISDMAAENANDLTTINVLYQKLSMQERLAFAVLDESEEMEAILDQMDTMIASYAQAGITVETMEMKTVTFLGKERAALYTASNIEGIPYYTLQIFDYDLGEYAVTLTLASYMEDNTQSLLDLFYAVE